MISGIVARWSFLQSTDSLVSLRRYRPSSRLGSHATKSSVPIKRSGAYCRSNLPRMRMGIVEVGWNSQCFENRPSRKAPRPRGISLRIHGRRGSLSQDPSCDSRKLGSRKIQNYCWGSLGSWLGFHWFCEASRRSREPEVRKFQRFKGLPLVESEEVEKRGKKTCKIDPPTTPRDTLRRRSRIYLEAQA